ncbi:MAG: HXXEE domain-containing protein [Lachnospiraceae bacterium]|nr:HXXEE domain-containing protein [Lachnospiraceae bacterium]
MREYLLLLPIIFIFHDMEEIIGFGWFFRNNPEIFKRFPIITKAYKDYTTAGMALAVITSIICLPISVIILINSLFTFVLLMIE